MPTATLTSIVPSTNVQSEIKPFINMKFGPNINVLNNNNSGKLDIGALPLLTKSIISSTGLNITPINGTSKLTINNEGVLNTLGSISTVSSINSASINVGTDKMTVSDTGLVYAANDLIIGTKFKVIARSGDILSGSLNVNGGITTTDTVKIGGTEQVPAITLVNTGIVNISNSLSVGGAAGVSGSLSVSGTVTMSDTLAVSKAVTMSDTLAVSKAVTMSDTLAVSKAVTMSDTLAVSKAVTMSDTLAVSKAVTMSDTLAVSKAVTMSDTLAVSKDLKVGANKFIVTASTGSASSDIPYTSYVPNAILSNTDITIYSTVEQNFTSSTNKLLTTQEYVDKEIWKQSKRINTILGKDSNELDNFNKVYEVITKLVGESDVVKTLTDVEDKYGSVIDKTNEINLSISDIISTAYNIIPVAYLPGVWADECPAMPIPSTMSQNVEDGWYFRNFGRSQYPDKCCKINWYLPAVKEMKVKDIQQLFLNLFAKSNKALPSIHFFTKAKGNASDLWPGLANAKVGYSFVADTNPESLSLTANKSYCLYTGEVQPYNIYNKIPLATADIHTVNNINKNTYSSLQQIDSTIISNEDTVLFFAIQTYNTFVPNDVECIINSLNIRLSTGTTQFVFNNSSVSNNYLYNLQFARNSDFSNMSSLYTEYFEYYNSTFINNLTN